MVCMDAFVSLVEVVGETIACRDAIVSPAESGETSVCMDAIVSLTEAAGEMIACVHAFVSGGGVGAEEAVDLAAGRAVVDELWGSENFFKLVLYSVAGVRYIISRAETRTLNGRLAQRESASLTRKRSQVQIL